MNLTRAALYIRVSNEEQVKEGYSLQAQKDNLVKVAKENGYLIVDTYTDEGITARKKYTKRKEFMRLISDVEAKKIDIILFIKLDRWFRNVADYYKIQEILDRNNVNWRATTENYDTTTANGRLYINIRLAVAQDEADRTSERIKFVFEKKVTEGEVISGNIPKGYRIKDKHLVIDEKEAELIRYIFNTYLILKSKRATMLQTTKNFGKHYSYNFVCRTLEREMYTGKYRNNTNFCPAIIDNETFQEVKKLLQSNPCRVPVKPTDYCYTFAGLIKCPMCGRTMVGHKTLKKNGKIYCYYRCPKRDVENMCQNSRRVKEKDLEDYLLEHLEEEVKKYKVEYEINLKKKKRPIVTKKSIENKLNRLCKLYINELIEIEDYKKEYNYLKNELEKISNIPTEEKKDFSELEKLLQSDFKEMYYSLNNQSRRALWHSVIDYITRNNDKNYNIFFK